MPGRDKPGNRMVHARFRDTEGYVEIVRYDRAGKWYLEPDGQERRRVGINDAAEAAAWGVENGHGEIFYGRPGGQSFDRIVRRLV